MNIKLHMKCKLIVKADFQLVKIVHKSIRGKFCFDKIFCANIFFIRDNEFISYGNL